MELPVHYLFPEMIILAVACLVTLLGLSREDSIRRLCQVIAAAGLLVALAVALISGQHYPADAFLHARYFNPNYITILACVIGFLTVLASWNMPSKMDPSVSDNNYRGEYFGMLLFSIAGVAMIGKVNDLVWLFIALELVSIPTYILVATGRSQMIAQEAGVKYFFLGALAAAIFLFGFSYLYGATGCTRFVEIHAWFHQYALAHPNEIMPPLALLGMLMVIIGVGYKMAAVPFHFYTPDVYQGAATPVTAYLAFAPKTAGLVAIISMLTLFDFNFTTPAGTMIMSVLTVIAAATMTVGNFLALTGQRNIKRILAYSSVAHSGYMLAALVAGPALGGRAADGVDAALFYLGSYAVMNLGGFAVLIFLQGKADTAEDLDDLAGVAREHPAAALMFSFALFSLIGMPLTVGFLAKLYIVQATVGAGHYVLATIIVLNAAVAAAYYLRIVAQMYLSEPLYPFAVRGAFPVRVTAFLCAVGVVILFFVPSLLTNANVRTHFPAEQNMGAAAPVAPRVIAASGTPR